MKRQDIRRRELLATVGGAGALALGVGTVGRRQARSRPYTKYTYAGTSDPESVVQVAWYEEYNGAIQETQGTDADAVRALDPDAPPTYVPEPTGGPRIALSDVLPGDAGRFVVGVRADQLPSSGERLAVTLSVDGVVEAENGVNEPEVAAGDDAGDAELAAMTTATVWLDEGLVPCDGNRGVGDTVLLSGSLRDVLDALRGGVSIGESCLGEGDHRCFGIEWALPVGTTDVVQTDSAGFDLLVRATTCGEEPA
jgi:hypothetical protein